MPRKHFRRFLPSHASIKRNRFIALFGAALHHHNLWHLNRRSVAGGVAVGLFCGLVPGPLQMLSAALLAVVLRVNLPVAAATTWYTNPLTIVPLYYAAYKLGVWVTGGTPGIGMAPPLDLSWANLGEWVPLLMQWMGAMGRPFAIGLLLLATILAVTGHFLVLGAWRLSVSSAWSKRLALRRARSSRP